MPAKFSELTFTPAVLAAQKRFYGNARRPAASGAPMDRLGPDEADFIATRDSFYLSTINESGWPYVQHRGGRTGFLHVLSPGEIAFADYNGNRQLLSAGNLAAADRVALFLMDYPQRTRLKILGHARVLDAHDHPELVAKLPPAAVQGPVERVFLIEVVAFDWNCPKYITPRYTADEIATLVTPLRLRIAELEAQVSSLGLRVPGNVR